MKSLPPSLKVPCSSVSLFPPLRLSLLAYTLSFVSPLSLSAPPFCRIKSDVSRHARRSLCPSPSMAKRDRWLLGRLPGRISGPVCVYMCVLSISKPRFSVRQWHRRPTLGPGCGTKPRPNNAGAAEGCDLETGADCDNSLAERRGGHLVSVATSQRVNVTVPEPPHSSLASLHLEGKRNAPQ